MRFDQIVMRANSVSLLKLCVAGLLIFSSASYAEGNRSDYDLDDDGLIEINDAEDFYAIESFWGKTDRLYGEAVGCPNDHCVGFELTRDIDFGHDAAPKHHKRITLRDSVFDGNGFTVSNLRIGGGEIIGFFSRVFSSVIRNLNIAKPFKVYSLNYRVGAIVGEVSNSLIINCKVSADEIRGSIEVGGIVGLAWGTSIINSHFKGVVRSSGIAGLVVGLETGNFVYASSGVGTIFGPYRISGLSGGAHDSVYVANSTSVYRGETMGEPFLGAFTFDIPSIVSHNIASVSTSTNEDTSGTYLVNNWVSNQSFKDDKNLNTLLRVDVALARCPEQANEDSCAATVLYPDWDQLVDSRGQTVWDFGDDKTLPKIRDNLYFSSEDSDGDWIPDQFDHYPNDKHYAFDFDEDGIPDRGTLHCKDDCRMTLDDDIQSPAIINPITASPKAESAGAAPWWLIQLLILLGFVRQRCRLAI